VDDGREKHYNVSCVPLCASPYTQT
jgi:hypothetical protein